MVDSLWLIRVISAVLFCRSVMLLESGHRCPTPDGKAPLLAADNFLVMDSAGFPGRAGHLFEQGMDVAYTRILSPIKLANAIGRRPATCQPEKAGP